MTQNTTSTKQRGNVTLATQVDRYNKAVDDYLAYGNYLKEKWEKQDPVQEMREFLAQYK